MSEYAKRLEFFNGGRWFRFPKDFLKILPCRESIVLALLVNRACLEIDNIDEEGFFRCSDKSLTKEIDLSPKQLEKSIGFLKKRKLISVKLKKSVPPRRLVFINIDQIEMDIDNYPRTGGNNYTRSGGIGISPKGDINNKEFVCAPAQTADSTTIYHKWARKFVDVILSNFNLKNPPKIDLCAKDFRMLWKDDKIDNDRIKRVLRWYCGQFNKTKYPYKSKNSSKFLPPYVPVALNGRTFRDKFSKIEAAMKRQLDDECNENEAPIKLNKHQKVFLNHMEAEFKNWKDRIRGLEKLIVKLYEWQEMANESIEREEKHPKVKELYRLSLTSDLNLYAGYAMWIVSEISRWDEWSGDLVNFHPGGKNFKRYMTNIMNSKQLEPAEYLRRMVDEA